MTTILENVERTGNICYSFQADIKSVQKQLVEQLTSRVLAGPGPPTRVLLAKCIAQACLVLIVF